jgi:hypothetical protein
MTIGGTSEKNPAGNVHDHLLSAQKRVTDELARSQRDWLLTVRHLCGCVLYSIRKSVYDGSRDRCRIEESVGDGR